MTLKEVAKKLETDLRLIHATAYFTGEKISADTVAEAALCSSIGTAKGQQKAVIGFPCAGDRMFGGTQNDEMVFVAPCEYVEKTILPGLDKTAAGGFSVFPVPPNLNWTPEMPPIFSISEADLQA